MTKASRAKVEPRAALAAVGVDEGGVSTGSTPADQHVPEQEEQHAGRRGVEERPQSVRTGS